jgi:DNA/RNA endonuclease YhcR with UshA esterase domain
VVSRFITVLVISVLISACGKTDKPEYLDDKEVKQETKPQTETPGDVKKTDSSVTNKNGNLTKQEERDKFSYQRSETPVATISPLEATDYMGKYVTVKGTVVDIYKSDKVAYLNFVEKYPNNPFTGVIFANKFEEFGNVNKYEGKLVEISGRVSTFRGKPQMILDKLSQIKIVN